MTTASVNTHFHGANTQTIWHRDEGIHAIVNASLETL